MTDAKYNKLCYAFDAYWLENNNAGDWAKHNTTLTGGWRIIVEEDPNPDWTDKEATLRINGLLKLKAKARLYNEEMNRRR